MIDGYYRDAVTDIWICVCARYISNDGALAEVYGLYGSSITALSILGMWRDSECLRG